MKCVLFIDPARAALGDLNTDRTIATLQAMAIRFDVFNVDNAPTGAVITANYDFVVIPRSIGTAIFTPIYNDADITIPMFSPFSSQGTATNFGSTPGVSARAHNGTYYFVDTDLSTSPWQAYGLSWYTLTDGTPIITASATDAISGGAQAGAGEVNAWATDTAGGNRHYIGGWSGAILYGLPLLMQVAINEGKLSKYGFKKLPLVFDIDHINDDDVHSDTTILDYLYSKIPAGGVIWCGVTDTVSLFDNMSAAVIDKLDQYKDKFQYCYHTHLNYMTSGTWPYGDDLADVKTKAQQATAFDAAVAVMDGHGLSYKYPAYNNAGGNRFNQDTLDLYTPDTTKTASSDDSATQQGYNYRVTRASGLGGSSRVLETNTKQNWNAHHRKTTVNGILVVNAIDVGSGLITGGAVYDTAQKWAEGGARDIIRPLSLGTSIYMHPYDFDAARQDPGADQHGVALLDMISDYAVYLKDIMIPFADPTKLVNPRSVVLT